MARPAPFSSRYAPSGMVCTVDHLASAAGVGALRDGGNAVDAAVAASAVLAVTSQHMCGMGGDLFALVSVPGRPVPWALNASGRSGLGADAGRLRSEGRTTMPAFGDIRSVPVPGCVDGWTELHGRLGRLPMAEVLAPAIRYAERGFPAAPLLVRAAPSVSGLPGGEPFAAATRPGATVLRPGVAWALREVASGGRDAFYQGDFGRGLIALGGGEFDPGDMAVVAADWVSPLSAPVWDRTVWTVPPNSQGYLALAGAVIASGLDLPADADDPGWAHLLIESARFAAFDRADVLWEGADGEALLSPARLGRRRDLIRPDRAADLPGDFGPGGTVFLGAVDEDRMGVALIQSNAMGFGALIAEPRSGIFLHNRGIGFSLQPGHPAELGPRRRPPHTLSPLLVTDGPDLDSVVGTMGGDSQPQVLLQLLARLLAGGEDVGDAVAAPRWVLRSPTSPAGFATWAGRGAVEVGLEPGAPPAWTDALARFGHRVAVVEGNYGHAHAIRCLPGALEAASDPRSLGGSAAGY